MKGLCWNCFSSNVEIEFNEEKTICIDCLKEKN